MTEQELILWMETNWWMIKLCVGIGTGMGVGLATYFIIGHLPSASSKEER